MAVFLFFDIYRNRLNISQAKLSKMAGVTLYTITKIESGATSDPRIQTVKKSLLQSFAKHCNKKNTTLTLDHVGSPLLILHRRFAIFLVDNSYKI